METSKAKIVRIIENNSPELAAEKIIFLFDIGNPTYPNCGAEGIKLENGLFRCGNWDCGNFAN